MKKILFVLGTRPEAIKMAPVINIFKKDTENFNSIVIVTGQHREMLDQVLSIFNIIPDYDLNLMSKNQSLEKITGKIIYDISNLLIKIQPSILFVQGDTTTAFSASLSAFYNKISVAHIEAGLRTNNPYSPFPEEFNRRAISIIASIHFAPTNLSCQNLLKEGVNKKDIIITGNTVIDALLTTSKKIDQSDKYENSFIENYNLSFKKLKTILVTGHRRESFGKKFENICKAIKNIVEKNNVQIVYPVHLNPNVYETVSRILGDIENIFLIPPQDYGPFIYLMKKSFIILTDSGGVQEEAPSLGKPVLVMRDNTERPEGIDVGTSKLVGTDTADIISSVELLLNNKNEYDKMSKAVNPYGDGKASENIYKKILNDF